MKTNNRKKPHATGARTKKLKMAMAAKLAQLIVFLVNNTKSVAMKIPKSSIWRSAKRSLSANGLSEYTVPLVN